MIVIDVNTCHSPASPTPFAIVAISSILILNLSPNSAWMTGSILPGPSRLPRITANKHNLGFSLS